MKFTPQEPEDPGFWPSSGFSLLTQNQDGHLSVTDDFLRAYFMRPEVAPVDESCEKELALHAALMQSPRLQVSDAQIDAFADDDAKDNYRVVLAFRDRLVSAGTIEGCYMGVFEEENVIIPPLFLDQMAHVILRNILDGITDPFLARAAELFFREQNVTLEQGPVLMGDRETVDMLATTGGMGSLGKLVVEAGTQARQVDLDVLLPETADVYWDRAEKYDTVLDISFARPGLDAFCRVMEKWIRHFVEAEVSIQPVQQISDEHWAWHIGLDAEATAMLNALYEGQEVDDTWRSRLLSLFRMDFKDPNHMMSDVRGRPVYMAFCMNPDSRFRMKPQNLLVNLPLAVGS